MTNLLDILKEADLRIGFTQHFRSPATRETLDRETLQKRFLLCLYGLGTNTGIKLVSMGDHGQSYQELLYTRRRYLHQDQLRAAIVDIADATFQERLPHIWGEGTTTCASDSTHFGAWNQNLMTEWHLRYGGQGGDDLLACRKTCHLYLLPAQDLLLVGGGCYDQRRAAPLYPDDD